MFTTKHAKFTKEDNHTAEARSTAETDLTTKRTKFTKGMNNILRPNFVSSVTFVVKISNL